MKTFNYQLGRREPFQSVEDIQLSDGVKGTFQVCWRHLIIKWDKGNLLNLIKTLIYQMGRREPFTSDENIQLSNGTKETF